MFSIEEGARPTHPTMLGTAQHDLLTTGGGDNVLVALAGDDTIFAQGGDDVIHGDFLPDALLAAP